MEYVDNATDHGESEYDDDYYDGYYVWPVWLLSTLQGIGVALGLPSNALLLVLFAVCRNKERSPSSKFLLQRAVCDGFTLMSYVYFIVQRETKHWKSSWASCVSVSIIMHVGTVGGIVFLVLFTMDSYLSSRPQHHTLEYRHKVMNITSALAWLFAAAFGVSAYFFTSLNDGSCSTGPFFSGMFNFILGKVAEAFVLLVIPLVVSWSFVSLALPPNNPALPRDEKQKGPNRSLLLGLTSLFTIVNGIYYLVSFIAELLPYNFRATYYIEAIAYSLPVYCDAISPLLVIYYLKELRQKVLGWLPARHSASLPLHNL